MSAAKSRRRSLGRKSIASSNLPKVHREFRTKASQYDDIDLSMSSTNELISKAFKEMSLNSHSRDSKGILCDRDENMSINHKKEDGSHPTCADDSERHCILTEDTESRSILGGGTCEVTEIPVFQVDESTSDRNRDVMSLKAPGTPERNLIRRRNEISSSSIDSGVYSTHGSKRPSVEQLNSTTNSNQTSRSSLRYRRSESICFSPEERDAPQQVSLSDGFKPSSKRLNVDSLAFAELVQAATKLIDDAHPVCDLTNGSAAGYGTGLKNSVQDFKRRRSEWDLPTLKPQHEGPVRKKSAEPVLQRELARTLNVESNRSRKVSACIICERNKRPSILIKTTMIRNMQESRRFSEVLKVCLCACVSLCGSLVIVMARLLCLHSQCLRLHAPTDNRGLSFVHGCMQ